MAAPAQAKRGRTRPAERQPPSDAALIATITVLLLSGLTLVALLRSLSALLAPFGISPAAVAAAIALIGDAGLRFEVGAGEPSAVRAIERTAAARRAMYVLAAVRRLARADAAGDEELRTAVTRERRWLNAHLAAEGHRRAAAERIDRAAARFGPVLGWHCVRDQRSTALHIAAHGHNFSAFTPPAIGWPGTPYGGNCRCRPVAPFEGAAVLT